MTVLKTRTVTAHPVTRQQQRPAHEKEQMDDTKVYLTVADLSNLINTNEAEITSAIRFGVLPAVKFPLRGVRRLRIEEGAAKVFARRFYAKLI